MLEETIFFHLFAKHPTFTKASRESLKLLDVAGVDVNELNQEGLRPLDHTLSIDNAEMRNNAIKWMLILGAFPRKSRILDHWSFDELTKAVVDATIVRDRESPFNPIFLELERLREQIPGGNEYVGRFILRWQDKGRLSLDEHQTVVVHKDPVTKFTYIYRLLLGLQELTSEAYLDLMRKHDSLEDRKFDQNKAAQFIFALTGIVIHPETSPEGKLREYCRVFRNIAFKKMVG